MTGKFLIVEGNVSGLSGKGWQQGVTNKTTNLASMEKGITRIVRMYYRTEEVPNFLGVFAEHRQKISSFPGCLGVQLMRDANDRTCLATVSKWDNVESLERYRQSELFSTVWAKVKPMFRQRAEAFTLEEV